MLRRVFLTGLCAVVVGCLAAPVPAAERFITVASTTSTQDSGLFDHLLPLFTQKTGIAVRVVAKGTGQAIKEAQNGDADVLFVHDKASEEKFVADGFGVKWFDVMYSSSRYLVRSWVAKKAVIAMPVKNAPMKNHQPKIWLTQSGVSDMIQSQAMNVNTTA